ncbi:MAG: sigma-54-dependent Fis family transcriptional regulator [Nitrospira sp.]|nr:MAG: sigma-54-dependent Fis family transcriptional regulator [Nitrospira sp.]
MTQIVQKTRCEEAVLLDCIGDGVVTIGLDMRIRYMNRAMRELLGYEQEELLGQPLSCHFLVQGSICSTQDCILERAIRNREKVRNYETVIQNKEGRKIPVSLNTDLLWDETGNLIGIVETYRDLSQINELKAKLEHQGNTKTRGPLVARSKALQSILDLLPQVANSKTTVLIEGESGTGKELIAREIHRLSPRRDQPFVAINCAALAEGVLESELFGHVKGAFTGAIADRPGRFELAHRGTIFLDEIADITPMAQAKLLRVLQEGEFERVGGNKTVKVDVRVVAATNKILTTVVEEGGFRDDLYYRLQVFPITVPPLRDRKEDLLPLIEHSIVRLSRAMGKNVRDIDGPALRLLEAHRYPGNVRELENILEHAFIRCPDHTIRPEHLPEYLLPDRPHPLKSPRAQETKGITLALMEQEAIVQALEQTDWNYRQACRILGVSRSTLLRRIKTYNLNRKSKSI